MRPFLQRYQIQQLGQHFAQPSLLPEPFEDMEEASRINSEYEVVRANWGPISIAAFHGRSEFAWASSPVRFVDGKNVGETVASIRTPDGFFVPVRLAQVGGIAMRLEAGEIRRESAMVEPIVVIFADLFPWHEIEEFAAQLQLLGLKLVTARLPQEMLLTYLSDFSRLTNIAFSRSREEMFVLEEVALSHDLTVPTIVDGPLEHHIGGFVKESSPVFGVIKTHYRHYLSPDQMQILQQLCPGERTPLFSIAATNLPVVSWYVALQSGRNVAPNSGFVRVEITQEWFEEVIGQDWNFVNLLSQCLYQYRCRDASYPRSATSLHPIVRAEQSLGSLMRPHQALSATFFRNSSLSRGNQ